MMLHSRALEAFITVAEELHFGRAAQRLHMSQPPLSQQIRRFEAALGVALFVRTTRSVSLTPAGAVLLKRARQLALDGDSAVHAARRASMDGAGHLGLGFTSTAAYEVLPALLSEYGGRYADTEFELKEAVSPELIEMLLSGKIDVALLRKPASRLPPSLVLQRFHSEHMCLAVPLDHALAQAPAVHMRDLDHQAFIAFSPQGSPYFADLQHDLFSHFGIQPKIVHQSVMPTLLALVEAGAGIALVPMSASRLRPGGVCYRTLEDGGEALTTDLYTAHPANVANPCVAQLLGVLHGGIVPRSCFSPPHP